MNENSPFSLCGKTILVTGASSGIGRACAVECAKSGAKIFASARSESRLAETLSALPGEGHFSATADFSEPDAIAKIVSAVPADSQLDGAIFAAGANVPAPFGFIKEENFSAQLNLNFCSPVLLAQELFRKKKLRKGASLVFISSVSGGNITAPATLSYTAAKSALDGAVKSIAVDLAAKKIRANAICPGAIETPMLESLGMSDEQRAADLARYPLKRRGKPEEVAYAAIYLLSDAASWITGTRLVIDGGYTLL